MCMEPDHLIKEFLILKAILDHNIDATHWIMGDDFNGLEILDQLLGLCHKFMRFKEVEPLP